MAELTRGLQATRGLLFVLNVIFLVFGLVLFVFGIYLIASKSLNIAFFENSVHLNVVGGSTIEAIGIILTVTGAFTVLLSLLGCLGALLRKKNLLWIYAVILTILMILELAAFITSIVIRNKINDSYRESLTKIFNDVYINNRTEFLSDIENLEKNMKCCGVNGSIDYENSNLTIPHSCYNKDRPSELYQNGCAKAIIDWIWDLLPAVSGIVGAVLFFEIFGVIASIILAYTLSNESYGATFAKL